MRNRKLEISLKSPSEIEKMRVAGRLAAQVLEFVEPLVKAGVTKPGLDLSKVYTTKFVCKNVGKDLKK